MRLWIWFLGIAFITSACLFSGESDECEIPSQELVSKIEGGLKIDGASLIGARAARSVAYERMWFLAARVRVAGAEDDPKTPIWGVDDLQNPELIWWANDRAREISNWGDEVFFSSSTDGIGTARFCAQKASES